MAQSFFMDSIEAATITLTNCGTNANSAALKWRNNNVKAINASGIAPQIEIDFGTATSVNCFLIGNYYTSDDVDETAFSYWNGASYTLDSIDGGQQSGTFANSNELYTLYSTRNATKYKINLTPSSTMTFQISNLFMGNGYFTTSTDYDYRNTRGSQFRGEVITDQYGNPYTHQINTTRKRIWDVVYRLSASELASFNTEFDKVGINQKAFYFLDERVSSTAWFLVKCENEALLPVQQSADLFELPLRLVQL